jgi:hypothetical protein
MRKVGEGFRMFSIPEKMPAAMREKRAEKALETLKALNERGVFEQAVEKLLIQLRKKAA